MTARGLYTLLFGALMLAVSLSVGSAGAMLMGGAALIAWVLSLACAVLAALLCRMEQHVEASRAERGESCRYTFTARLPLPLPLAPLALRVCLPSGRQSEFSLPSTPWVRCACALATASACFHCPGGCAHRWRA